MGGLNLNETLSHSNSKFVFDHRPCMTSTNLKKVNDKNVKPVSHLIIMAPKHKIIFMARTHCIIDNKQ